MDYVVASDPNLEKISDMGEERSTAEDSGALQAKADRCRRLAAGISDKQAADVLTGMARSYQEAAERITKPHL